MAVLDKIKDKLAKKDKNDEPQPSSSGPSASAVPKPTIFDHNKVIVIFVLGGPGVGKGTQCDKLVEDFDFVHLSAGDLLREEQHRQGSQYGELIGNCIREGKIVPSEVTVKLLENAIRDALSKPHDSVGWEDGRGRFLVDGFPRQMDQAHKFDEEVCLSAYVLFFTCTEEVMLQRLLERGKTSGREDDNAESAKKRFRTYQDTTMPVIDHYRGLNKTVEIDATRSIDDVYTDTKRAVDQHFAVTAGLPPPQNVLV